MARTVGSRRRGGRGFDAAARGGQSGAGGHAVTLSGQRVVVVGGTSGMGLATVRAALELGVDDIGTLDHLFVSASPGAPGPFLEQDLAAARSFVDGKLLGSWTCARYAAPRMPAGGSITFITGAAVVRPPGNAAMVTAAFAAV